ncbi:MAG: response regulator [Bryobacteraceae bacterium]
MQDPIRSKTILILNSDVQRRTQMRYVLSSQGYKVLEATNLEQAGTLCSGREISIDLAILDAGAEPALNWPIWHPCAQLVTIFSECEAQNPPDDFWQLPFDPDQLLSRVRSAVGDSGAVKVSEMRAVLIVEDNELLRHAVATMLRRCGFSAFEAEDGSSAIAQFKAHEAEIGLIVLDMTLPGMSGEEVFETLEQIRPGVKVILTTAHSQGMIESVIGSRKPWVFVRKPYRVSDLLTLIQMAQTQEATE